MVRMGERCGATNDGGLDLFCVYGLGEMVKEWDVGGLLTIENRGGRVVEKCV